MLRVFHARSTGELRKMWERTCEAIPTSVDAHCRMALMPRRDHCAYSVPAHRVMHCALTGVATNEQVVRDRTTRYNNSRRLSLRGNRRENWYKAKVTRRGATWQACKYWARCQVISLADHPRVATPRADCKRRPCHLLAV